MDVKLFTLIITFLASQSSAIPIQCHEEVSGVYFGNAIQYEFTPTADTVIQASTCGYTMSWDTYIEVRANGVALDFSDNLGGLVCPGTPQASAVTVGALAGRTYQIILRHGNLYQQQQQPKQYSMNLHCSDSIEQYWAGMFNNTIIDYSRLSAFNNIWFYDGVSTCVGRGRYFHICPFHHIYCPGGITYGYGSMQRDAVIDAVSMSNRKYPGFTDCPIDLTCNGRQYTCANEVCVDVANLCDGTDDCQDGYQSDEDNGINLGLCDQNTPAPVVTPAPGEDNALLIPGCMDTNAVNYDPVVNFDDGSCEYCFDYGESLHLVTDKPSRLLPERCALAANGDLELACRASMKYPTTIVSILEPHTGDKPFDTEFIDQGITLNSSPQYWTRTPGELCTNDYDGVFAWSELLKDDDSTRLVRTDINNMVMFTGFIALDMFEQLDPLRGVNLTRWVRQKLPFRILFETDIMMTTGQVEVHDNTNALFAIIEQKTVVINGAVTPPTIEADIILWSSVQWPYRLRATGVSVNVPTLNNPALSVTLNDQCSVIGQEACNQKFLIHVALQDRCTFTGRYTVTFDIECLPGANTALCPLQPGQHTAGVDFDLQSENVCPTIVDEIVAVGSARSFLYPRVGTQQYAVPQHYGFMVNQWAYFEINVESIDGLVVETTITSVELCLTVGCGAPILLYNGAPTLPAVQLAILDYPRNPVTSPLPTKSDIHIFLANSVFNVPIDGSATFQLQVGLDVEYYHTQNLLEEGEERDLSKITLESYRHTSKTRKVHLTTVADRATMDVNINGEIRDFGERIRSASDTTDDAADAADAAADPLKGSAASTQTSYVVMLCMSVFVIALTVAIWR